MHGPLKATSRQLRGSNISSRPSCPQGQPTSPMLRATSMLSLPDTRNWSDKSPNQGAVVSFFPMGAKYRTYHRPSPPVEQPPSSPSGGSERHLRVCLCAMGGWMSTSLSSYAITRLQFSADARQPLRNSYTERRGERQCSQTVVPPEILPFSLQSRPVAQVITQVVPLPAITCILILLPSKCYRPYQLLLGRLSSKSFYMAVRGQAAQVDSILLPTRSLHVLVSAESTLDPCPGC